MKQIFLACIIMASFSELIFTSESNNSFSLSKVVSDVRAFMPSKEICLEWTKKAAPYVATAVVSAIVTRHVVKTSYTEKTIEHNFEKVTLFSAKSEKELEAQKEQLKQAKIILEEKLKIIDDANNRLESAMQKKQPVSQS